MPSNLSRQILTDNTHEQSSKADVSFEVDATPQKNFPRWRLLEESNHEIFRGAFNLHFSIDFRLFRHDVPANLVMMILQPDLSPRLHHVSGFKYLQISIADRPRSRKLNFVEKSGKLNAAKIYLLQLWK